MRPRSECREKGVKTVGVRRADAAKQDAVRSRLVCTDFKMGKHTGEMFAHDSTEAGEQVASELGCKSGLARIRGKDIDGHCFHQGLSVWCDGARGVH